MAASAAVAQGVSRRASPCDGKVVTSIAITPHDPSFLAVPRQLRAVARAVGVLHTTSTEQTISRFLLVNVGQPCTEKHRAESERILRLQPFLADATVRVVPDGDGVHIDVETIDEIPTVVDMRVRGGRASQFRFGNGNIGGQGLYLAASVERGLAYRAGFGLHGVANQVLGRPFVFFGASPTTSRAGAAAWRLRRSSRGPESLASTRRRPAVATYCALRVARAYGRPARNCLSTAPSWSISRPYAAQSPARCAAIARS